MDAEIFREEASELLDDIEETLMELREASPVPEQLNRLFRAFHTIKGSGAMFGFDGVAAFTHDVESAIDAVRQGTCPFSPPLLDLLLASRDQILRLIDEGAKPSPATAAEGARLREALIAWRQPAAAAPPSKPAPPSLPAAAPAPAVSAAPAPVVPAAPGVRPLRMLVVEDEFVSRYLLQEFLGRYGVSHVAVDGYEAILAFKAAHTEKRPYDLVCLDIMMPGLDGREVAKEMRRLETELVAAAPCRIVMTTAVSDSDIVLDMFQSQLCDAYMVKPINFPRLAELIDRFF
ncbi:MAG: Hpt domain-containing protein [Thermodesulfobacteriota bacterium]